MLWCRFKCLASLALWLTMCHCVESQDTKSTQPVTDDEIIASGKLPRFEPLSPEDEQNSFEVADGFRVELVAAEPLVIDPVAFCFDPKGRMIVVEMRGYSERAASKLGRVRRLSDTDFDGQMDEAETLIDGLEWPTAVACWGDGIVIGVAPDILYLPLSEDGKHGPVETLFTGFGKSNVQGLFNSFQWGPDLKLHCATSSSGALVAGKTIAGEVRLGRRDFTIDYHTRELTPVNGGGQHGMSFDRWGNKFVCSNSDHLQQVLLLPRVPGRSFTFEEPPFRRSIAADGPQAQVFRRSPVEPWRILRTHLRVNGLAKGPIEGGGKAAGYFTGATGIHLYEGDQWARDAGAGLALVCDVGSNLIHRKRLTAVNRLWFTGKRVDENTEFLRSTDTWFRPVQLGGGPDGALYVADMYREVIEHPKSLPPAIKSQVDLNSGNDRGRIWRIVSDGKRPRTRIVPSFDSLESKELLRYLSHANLWHRRTAARLLMQRARFSGSALTRLVDKLRDLATRGEFPETRLEALSLLGSIPNGFDKQTRDQAIVDHHQSVRRRALRLAIEHVERLDAIRPTSLEHPVLPDFMLAYGSAALLKDFRSRLELLGSLSSSDRHLRDLGVLGFVSEAE
ncbi:MAG: PVC-type heme-binding CxxCH protein, partial [Planctomycetota bacterium]